MSNKNRRIKLQEVLCNIIGITEPDGDTHVYYQPPESVKMKYPAIKFSREDIDNTFADDTVYTQSLVYQIIVMDKKPDSEIVEKVSKLPKCKFVQHYKANNLNHDIFTIFY